MRPDGWRYGTVGRAIAAFAPVGPARGSILGCRAAGTQTPTATEEDAMPRESFHHELRDIEDAVIEMGALVEREIAQAMQALTRRDAVVAHAVVTSDGVVNALQHRLRSQSIGLIALQAPVACDLRELTTVLLVINELERMGDHAVDIAQQSLRVLDDEPHPLVGALSAVAQLVRQQVRVVMQAFIEVNVQQAREIGAKDDEIDHRYRTIFAELINSMMRDTRLVTYATSLLFIAHDLERIGDRVINICEDIIYRVSGESVELH
jgi:phosphate transport system protein